MIRKRYGKDGVCEQAWPRSALSVTGSESKMLCCAVLLGGKAGNTSFEVHTFLVVVYARIELKYKTVFGYEKSDNT